MLDLMKQHELEIAASYSLPLNEDISLVPIGNWILTRNQCIQSMAEWRFQSRENFFARFPLSADTFSQYLKDHSIGNSSNITFALLGKDETLHGHMGLKNITANRATIDAVMIRQESRGGGLAKLGLESLFNWGNNVLRIKSFELEVLSSNSDAISLYSRMGFSEISRSHLRHATAGQTSFLVDCEPEESDAEDFKSVMCLDFKSVQVT